jgi:dTDP-glucose 4,6-dehydratase
MEARKPLAPTDLEEVVRLGEDLWAGLDGARLLLTGCTGFFGAWLLETLLAAVRARDLRLEAVLLTRDPEAYARAMPHLAGHPAVTLCRGDVRRFEPDGAFTHLVHGAVSTDGALYARQPLEILDTLVAGTRHALEVAAGRGVRRALFLSSGAVYGPQPPTMERLAETCPLGPDPMEPATLYAQGKRMAEHLCRQFQATAGLEVAIARGFAFLGPHLPLDLHFAAGNFLRDALAGGPVRVAGDGTPLRSYLYGTDLALWLWTLLLRGPSCRPVNVGSDRPVSIADLAAEVARAASCEVVIAGRPEPGRLPARYVPDTGRATELGLGRTVELDEAIRRTLRWLRQDRARSTGMA